MSSPFGDRAIKGLKSSLEPSDYPENWDEISWAFRKSRDFTCEICRVDCREHTALTDAHHKNADKSDCRYENLMCLCTYHHSKQHPHMKIPERKMEKLRQLWEEQDIPHNLRAP